MINLRQHGTAHRRDPRGNISGHPDARLRQQPTVPVTRHDPPAVARQFVGELLRIAGAEDLRRRIVPETPCGKGDRGQQRLQITRRHVDDQPPDLAGAHRHQFRGDDLEISLAGFIA